MDETGTEIARGFGSGYPGGEAREVIHLIMQIHYPGFRLEYTSYDAYLSWIYMGCMINTTFRF